jgi:hypothetical protein
VYRLLAVLAAALGLLLALGAGSASAALCGTTAGTVTVTMASGESIVVRVGAGDAITVNGVSCGGTTSTVDTIVVFGTDAGSETVTIDETAGRFEPGLTTGEPGLNEIEWFVNLGDPGGVGEALGGSDTLIVSDIQVAGAGWVGAGGEG